MSRRVLVVEDDPEFAGLLALWLERAGASPRIATTGTGAVITLFSAYVLGLLDAPQAVEDPAPAPNPDASGCEPQYRRRPVKQWAPARKRPHAGARTRVRPRS